MTGQLVAVLIVAGGALLYRERALYMTQRSWENQRRLYDHEQDA